MTLKKMKLIHLTESVEVTLGANQEEISYKAKKLIESNNGVLIPTIEAVHSKVTRNMTFYGPSRLKGKEDYVIPETGEKRPSGVYSWTTPFNKPMLVNHDIRVDPLGRVVKAEYKSRTSAGIPGIVIYPEITDPEAALKVLDGRYSTVSIGADTNAAFCSICKKNQVEEWCDHRRGRVYDGKLCYWSMGEIWFGECSFVNAPSDELAGVKEIPITNKESTLTNLGFLIKDLQQHRLYDLSRDELYAITDKGLVLIPRTEYMQEYFYVPFNIKIYEEENEPSVSDESKAGEDPNRPKGKDKKTPIGKMKTGNQKQAYYGHNLLHGYWRKGNTNWTKDQIKKEHARVVRIILNKGWRHRMIDGLDDTLPEDLKERTRAQAKKDKKK